MIERPGQPITGIVPVPAHLQIGIALQTISGRDLVSFVFVTIITLHHDASPRVKYDAWS